MGKKQECVRKCSGELKRAMCRLCRKFINFQWYCNHLELFHPKRTPASGGRQGRHTRLNGGVKVKKVIS